MKTDRKQLYKHDYFGSCIPENSGGLWHTFSVGIFKWLQKSDGIGLKKSTVIFRLYGNSSNPDEVYKAAEEICDRLDKGTLILQIKSSTVSKWNKLTRQGKL